MKPCLIWLILILAYACPNLAVEHGDDELLAVACRRSVRFFCGGSIRLFLHGICASTEAS